MHRDLRGDRPPAPAARLYLRPHLYDPVHARARARVWRCTKPVIRQSAIALATPGPPFSRIHTRIHRPQGAFCKKCKILTRVLRRIFSREREKDAESIHMRSYNKSYIMLFGWRLRLLDEKCIALARCLLANTRMHTWARESRRKMPTRGCFDPMLRAYYIHTRWRGLYIREASALALSIFSECKYCTRLLEKFQTWELLSKELLYIHAREWVCARKF